MLFGLRALPAREAEIAARRALARVGLEHYVNEYPHTLSGGEQQRVALARSIAPRPGVLLMDEPFSNLDRRLRDAIRDETVAILRETGATTIVVTHDPGGGDADRRPHRADAGRAHRAGRAPRRNSTIARSTIFAARFFCDFNEVEGQVRNGQVSTALGGLSGAPA